MATETAANSVTEARDLRTGTPVWSSYASSALTVEILRQGIRAGVVVVGAGVTGALIAEALSSRGLSTVVLDRRQPGHGSTAASTALLQFDSIPLWSALLTTLVLSGQAGFVSPL